MRNLAKLFLFVCVLCASAYGYKSDGECRDKLSSYKCGFLNKHRACKTNPVRMAVYCPKTCGYCAPKASCKTTKCSPNKICVDTNKGPICRCLVECKKKMFTGTVCGKNGKTYPDLCDLINDGCHVEDHIMVEHYGPCKIQAVKCEDSERESKLGLCKSWQEDNACFEHTSMMRDFCPKTCGFCRQPIEPKCKRSKFGCCWDGQGDVAATGKYGAGCGKCQDKRFCKYFRRACGGTSRSNTMFMKKVCPETCHYCKSSINSTT